MSMTAEGMVAVQRSGPVTATTLELIASLLEVLIAEQRELRAIVAPAVRAMPATPMSPAEFGRAIGKSAKTVRRWIETGKLRARKVGKVTLIRPVDAQRFLEGGGR